MIDHIHLGSMVQRLPVIANPGGDMGFSYRHLMAAGLCVTLAACNTPRGAGFQSEVIAAASPSQSGEEAAFEVVAVTRDSQSGLAAWPVVGDTSRSWIRNAGQPSSMIINTGDVVTVTVWETGENALLAGAGGTAAQLQDAVVSSNGEVFLPFVGDLKISGMSPETARQRIEEKYLETIPSAQVQISVTPGRANTANLVSGVGAPGVYPLEGRNVTVLSLIAQGGGARGGMENPQVKLMRGSSVYGISLDRLFDNPSLDAEVRGGDRILIEEDDRTFLALGAAGTQSEFVFPDDHVTALQALSLIGGVDAGRANPKGVLVLREYPASALRTDGTGPAKEQVVFTVDLTTADGLFAARNFEIMAGDLVYATESPINSARSVLGLIGATLGISNSF